MRPVVVGHTNHSSTLSKLRKMLEAGIPVGAVEQRANMLGLDMSLVLGNGDGEKDATKKTTTTGTDNPKGKIPPHLLNKYQRMLRNNVPLKGVQCQAFIDGEWSPEDLLQSLDENTLNEIRGIPEFYQPSSSSPRMSPMAVGRKRPRCDETESSTAVFTVQEDGNINVIARSTLAAFIRKTTPTPVQQKEEMIVIEPLPLYRILGSLQGV